MTTTNPPVSDVFFSYNRADRDAAQTLLHFLREKAGLIVFLDECDLIPGSAWRSELGRELVLCRSAAVLVGPHFPGPNQSFEVDIALNRLAQQRDSFRVIPVLLPGADLSSLGGSPLSTLTWVQFEDSLDDEQVLHKLVCGIRGLKPGAKALAFNTLANVAVKRSYFVFSGVIDQYDQVTLNAILESLRRMSSDLTIVVKEISTASVKLLVEGTELGIERIEFLFNTGQLPEIHGCQLIDIRTVESSKRGALAALRVVRSAGRIVLSLKNLDAFISGSIPKFWPVYAPALRGESSQPGGGEIRGYTGHLPNGAMLTLQYAKEALRVNVDGWPANEAPPTMIVVPVSGEPTAHPMSLLGGQDYFVAIPISEGEIVVLVEPLGE